MTITLIEDEVREQLRAKAIDPGADPEAVRGVIADVVAATGVARARAGLPASSRSTSEAKAVFDAVAGYGPLQEYLDDPSVEEIWLNEPARVFVARSGVSELTPTILTHDQIRVLIERMLRTSGRRLDLSSPFVDASLPDGSRLHVAIPDVTREYWAINIRKFVAASHSMDELVNRGSLSPGLAAILAACVKAGLNVLVSGQTQRSR